MIIPARAPWQRMWRTVLPAGTAAIAALLGAGFLNALHPALDSVSHFRLHLAALLALSSFVLWWRDARVMGFCALFFGMTALAANIPVGHVFAGSKPPSQNSATYRLLQINMLFDNPKRAELLSFIRSTQADVVTLEEVNDQWVRALASLDDLYPNKIICGARPEDGVAIFSRLSFGQARTTDCVAERMFVRASVDFDGKTAVIAATHLRWPWPFPQFDQIDALAEPIRQLDRNAILAGDFNATPWSAAVDRIVKRGGLNLVPSIGPTWLSNHLPASWRFAGLAIDHIMYKGDVVVHSVRKVDAPGSDHLALIVEFTP